MRFARETLDAVWSEITPLLVKHWQEIAHYKDIALEPDWEQYLKLEELGLLRVYTAREESEEQTERGENYTTEKLRGYAVFLVRHNPHYKSSLQANQDILFVDPEHRGLGGQFILWCDEQLKAEGVQVVYQHVKAEHNFGRMLERFGYKLVDLIFARRLD